MLKSYTVKEDGHSALEFLRMAVDNGYPHAMRIYACTLRDGSYFNVDLRESARYFKLAADKGNSKAMFQYANILLTGEGADAGVEESARFLKMAADNGDLN